VGENVFNVFNIVFMVLLMLITIYPLWYVLVASLSNPVSVARGDVVFLPDNFETLAYQSVFAQTQRFEGRDIPVIWTAYGNTIFYATVGTLANMLLTVLCAYPLSKPRLRGRKPIMLLILITMWFNAGMIPTFFNFQSLGLTNTRLGIILCFTISTFYVILMRTFFESIPQEMEDAAIIDGANDWVVLTRIHLPLSTAAIATLTMFYFVDRWNAFFWSMLLLRDPTLVPLQVVLRRLIVEASYSFEHFDVVANISEQTLIYATIVIAVVPMLALYPFIQRFFVRGIMVGAIKG
jgi:putative aldouronate transport system permease protein